MQLDDAYANGKYIDNAAAFVPKWTTAAQAFRDTTLKTLDIPYGPSPRTCFDLFRPGDAARGTVIFVHGGYWLDFDKSTWSHLAAGAVVHGWAVAMPSYDLCPAVRISDITRQIAAAVGVVAGQTSGPIRLVGHSAGGHLVARMLDTTVAGDWLARVDRTVPISPLADLAPLLCTTMNERLQLTPSEARAESPVHQPRPASAVSIVVGGNERPAFLDQADWLAKAWGCDKQVHAGKHHFNIIEELALADSALTRNLVG